MGGMKVSNPYDEPTIPITMNSMLSDLFEENKNRVKEDYNVKKINYCYFSLRDKRPFSWENEKERKNGSLLALPTKLYNVEKDKVELVKDNSEIKNYAILSYT